MKKKNIGRKSTSVADPLLAQNFFDIEDLYICISLSYLANHKVEDSQDGQPGSMNLSDQLGTLLPAKFVADEGKDNSDFYQRKILKTTTIKFITKKKEAYKLT